MAAVDDALTALGKYQTIMQGFDPNYNLSQGYYNPLNNMSQGQQIQHVANQLQKTGAYRDLRGYKQPGFITPQKYSNPNSQTSGAGQQTVGSDAFKIDPNQPMYKQDVIPGMKKAGEIRTNQSMNPQALLDAKSMIAKMQQTAPAGEADKQAGVLFNTLIQARSDPKTDYGQHPLQTITNTAKANDPVFQQWTQTQTPEYQTANLINTKYIPQVQSIQQGLIDWAVLRNQYDHANSKARAAMGGAPSYRGLTKYVTGPMSPANVLDTAQNMSTPEGQMAMIQRIVTEESQAAGKTANQQTAVQQTAIDPQTGAPFPYFNDMSPLQNMLYQHSRGGVIGLKNTGIGTQAPQTPKSYESNKKAGGSKSSGGQYG